MAGMLGIGQSALRAAYTQLQTTSHNIANVSTPGYSKQEALFSSAGAVRTGAGWLGMGVETTTIRRSYDRFLTAELAGATASQAAASSRAELIGRADRLLADTDNGIGVAIDKMNLALADVVNRPFDPSARQSVLLRADTLAQRVRDTDRSLQQLNDEASRRINEDVGVANTLLKRFADLNGRIALATGGGQPPNDLLDERDRVLMSLNEKLRVSAHAQDNGAINLFAAGGEGLVVGGTAASLVNETHPSDPSKTQMYLVHGSTKMPMASNNLGGGSIAGLLEFRDQDLESARSRLGQLAAGIAAAFNAQQAAGVDATGTPGEPMFKTGAPQVYSASTNAGTMQVSAKVVDGGALVASDYRIRYDGEAATPGYVVTRLSDGFVHSSVTFPIAIDGLQFDIKPPAGAPQNGDTFTVQSATAMAGGFERVLSSASRLASGYAMTPEMGTGNAGDLSVADFAITNPASATLTRSVSMSFDGAGNVTIDDGTNPPAMQAYAPGQPISMNGWSVTLRGTPQAGDTMAIQPVANPANDNRNAKAMLALSDRPLVGGATFNDSFAAILADVGGRTQAANTDEKVSGALLANAQASQSSLAGVNLDEEAARLMQYQQMYQAAAKVIQAGQSMFDTLISSIGR